MDGATNKFILIIMMTTMTMMMKLKNSKLMRVVCRGHNIPYKTFQDYIFPSRFL